MGRKEPAKGIHTSPDKAGIKNMENVNLPKDELNLMGKLNNLRKQGDVNSKAYKGLWTEETLLNCVNDFFEFCTKQQLKPTKPALQIWLGVSRDTYWDWETKREKYTYKCDIINKANRIMECYLQGQIDKYPTGSIFLLKTSHQHIEASKIDITSNGNQIGASADEIKDLVSKLGLDQDK